MLTITSGQHHHRLKIVYLAFVIPACSLKNKQTKNPLFPVVMERELTVGGEYTMQST